MKKIACAALSIAMLLLSIPGRGSAYSILDDAIGVPRMSDIQDAPALPAIEDAGSFPVNFSQGTMGYFTYSDELIDYSGKMAITGCDKNASGEIVIPSEINGKKVEVIYSLAFMECTKITSIVIPENVTVIEMSAFYGCTSLVNISFPNSLARIRNYAFEACNALTSVTLPASVTEIGNKPFRACVNLEAIHVSASNPNYVSEEGVLFNKAKTQLIDYPAAKSTKTYIVPSTVKEIRAYAAHYSKNLESVTIPNGTTNIGSEAFRYGKALKTVNIGNGVSDIAPVAFGACVSLTEINVSSSNSYYSSRNGVLYNKGETELISCPGGFAGEFTIPNSVTRISTRAFESCLAVTKIVMPSSVTVLGNNAFLACRALLNIEVAGNNPNFSSKEGVLFNKAGNELISFPGGRSGEYAIPESTTIIKSYAFYDCSGLDSVTLPASIVQIEDYAFFGADLKYAIFLGKRPTSAGQNVFGNPDTSGAFSIYYTAAHKDDWQQSGNNWRGYAIYMLEGSGTDGNGFAYIIVQGGARIISYTGQGGVVTVPSSIMGRSVEWIGTGLFMGMTNITRVVMESGLTAIPDNMFKDCVNLATVQIPSTVRSIGKSAFYGCRSLGTEVFSIPASIGSIAEYAFYGCVALGSVTIPGGVTAIAPYAFYGCSSLSKVSIAKTVTSIGMEAFRNCTSLLDVTIPASVVSIGEGAFMNCRLLQSVTIGSAVNHIGNYAFMDCTSLLAANFDAKPPAVFGQDVFKNVNAAFVIRCFEEYLPYWMTNGQMQWNGYPLEKNDLMEKGFVYIVDENETATIIAYRGDESLLSIPSRIGADGRYEVAAIAAGAFKDMAGIIAIEIPKSILTIGEMAFYRCENLNAITVDSANQAYASFDGMLFDRNLTKLIYCPDAREGNATLPNGVKEIEGYAFANCYRITSVKLPEGITKMGAHAFEDCMSISGIVIPGSVTQIGNNAFTGCLSLIAACFKGEPPAVFGADMFESSPEFKIRYLSANAQAWNFGNQGSYRGYSIEEFSSFPAILLMESSTYTLNGAYLCGIKEKTIVVELIMLAFQSKGLKITNNTGKTLGDYALVGTGCRVQLVHFGAVLEELVFVMQGDVNGDAIISSLDIAAIQTSILKTKVLVQARKMGADTNLDGVINTLDISYMQRRMLGLS